MYLLFVVYGLLKTSYPLLNKKTYNGLPARRAYVKRYLPWYASGCLAAAAAMVAADDRPLLYTAVPAA